MKDHLPKLEKRFSLFSFRDKGENRCTQDVLFCRPEKFCSGFVGIGDCPVRKKKEKAVGHGIDDTLPRGPGSQEKKVIFPDPVGDENSPQDKGNGEQLRYPHPGHIDKIGDIGKQNRNTETDENEFGLFLLAPVPHPEIETKADEDGHSKKDKRPEEKKAIGDPVGPSPISPDGNAPFTKIDDIDGCEKESRCIEGEKERLPMYPGKVLRDDQDKVDDGSNEKRPGPSGPAPEKGFCSRF